MTSFKIGDRVRYTSKLDDVPTGSTGTVTGLPDSFDIYITWDHLPHTKNEPFRHLREPIELIHPFNTSEEPIRAHI